MITINIAKEFTRVPGPRYRDQDRVQGSGRSKNSGTMGDLKPV